MAQMSRYKVCTITLLTLIAFAYAGTLQAEIRSSGTHTMISDVIGTSGIIALAQGADYTEHSVSGQSMSIVSDSTGVYNGTLFTGFLHPKMKQTSEPMVYLYFDSETVDEGGTVNLNLRIPESVEPDSNLYITVKFEDNGSNNMNDYSVPGMIGNTVTLEIEGDESSTSVAVSINQDIFLEGIETITASIVGITDSSGDKYVNKSLVTRDSIKINANDNFSISGSVFYEGNQTGNVIIAAYTSVSCTESDIVINSNAVAFTTCSFEVGQISDSFMINNVPIGSYTIVSFMDSDTGTNQSMQSWEAAGYYTSTVVINEGDDQLISLNTITLMDPDDRYENQYANDTSTYAQWVAAKDYSFASEEANGAYIDSDQDGYANYWEYVNGTDPLVVDEPYLYAGYDPTTDSSSRDTDEKYQFVFTSPSSPLVYTNNFVLMDLNYDNNDNNNFHNQSLNGLGIAVHFDSSKLDFAGYSALIDSFTSKVMYPLTPLASNPNTYSWYNNIPDDDGTLVADDGYDSTDKVIPLAWLKDGMWPGLEVNLPLTLCRLSFKAKENWSGVSTTVVRFTASSTDARYQFYASPVTITLGDFNLDIDNNGKADGLTDGLLIMRYLYGLMYGGQLVQDDAIADDATRKLANEIFSYLDNGRSMLDVDDSGHSDALTDGLIILRYLLLDVEDESLVLNAVSDIPPNEANRTTAAEILPFVKQLIPE